jgi:hypothetical protein
MTETEHLNNTVCCLLTLGWEPMNNHIGPRVDCINFSMSFTERVVTLTSEDTINFECESINGIPSIKFQCPNENHQWQLHWPNFWQTNTQPNSVRTTLYSNQSTNQSIIILPNLITMINCFSIPASLNKRGHDNDDSVTQQLIFSINQWSPCFFFNLTLTFDLVGVKIVCWLIRSKTVYLALVPKELRPSVWHCGRFLQFQLSWSLSRNGLWAWEEVIIYII